MASTLQDVLGIITREARTAAGNDWQSVGSAIVSEIRIFGQRLAQIEAGYAAGELTEEDAKDFFAIAHNNLIAMIAMSTTLVYAAVQRIINAALKAAKDAINSFVKFPLFIA